MLNSSDDKLVQSQSSSTRQDAVPQQSYLYEHNETNILSNMGINRQDVFQPGKFAPTSNVINFIDTNIGATGQSTMHEESPVAVLDTGKTPQRPQDLIDQVSFGVPKVNVTSSAQYRKSYAFKIWRDKGFFPYRLAKGYATQEGKQKTRKQMNALKVQRDRENEEAWRAFKSSKSINKEIHKDKIRPDDLSGKDQVKLNMAAVRHEEDEKYQTITHQNGIPYYFKSKKDDKQKAKNNSKSIPTSVIHVINTPSNCQNLKSLNLQNKLTELTTGCSDENSSKDGVEEAASQIPHTTSSYTSVCQVDISNTRSTLTCKASSFANHVENLCHDELPRHQERNSVESFCRGATTSDIRKDSPTTMQSMEETIAVSSEGDVTNHGDEESGENVKNTATNSSISNQDRSNMSTTETSNGSTEAENNATLTGSSLVAAMKNSLGQKYCKENVKPDTTMNRTRKRKREGNGKELHDQPGKNKLRKLTVFTQLDEKVATNLADGIHNVNSEYFPISALANKAAKETGSTIQTDTSEISRTKKIEEIVKARLLLKELFDVTLESDGNHEMKTFDAESRSFGRKNILNHLSLLDRYFAEFQNKLSTETF